MKNFLEAKFQLFGQINLQFFFQKIALNRPKKFSKCFLAKLLKKNLASASAVAGKNSNSGSEIYEMS